MKKIIIPIVAIFIASVASAQPRAIGLRLGYGIEASYEHTLGDNFIEAEIGWQKKMYQATGLYNFIITSPSWTSRGEWNVYGGPGITLGGNSGYGFLLGVVGQVGLEYTFDFPLQLSADIRPQFNIPFNGNQSKQWVSRFGLSWIPSISVRYAF